MCETSMLEDLVQAAHRHQAARAQQRHAVAQRLGVGQDVGREEDGLPGRLAGPG